MMMPIRFLAGVSSAGIIDFANLDSQKENGYACRPLLPFAVREQLAENYHKAEIGEEQADEGPLAKHVRHAIEEHREDYRNILKRSIDSS